jgi:hypothetical protein
VLAASRKQYERQQHITALGLTQTRRLATRGSVVVARTLGPYQAASIALSLEMAPAILSEQGISPAAVANINPASLLTGAGAADLLDNTVSGAAFDRLILSLIQDAGRTASTVSNAIRPAVTGYVRYLNPPSCGRCAVLAGRVYRYSQGFQRHPRCDCQMNPTNETVGPSLITSPKEAFDRGQIRELSQGDVEAISKGADISQVINVRRQQAGLLVGSSVIERAGRLTPQGVLRIASSRTQQIALLQRYGYLN